MEEMAASLGELYGLIYSEVGKQQLEINGPAFVHYLDFDEATGFSNYQPGVPVSAAGKKAGAGESGFLPGDKGCQGSSYRAL